MVWELIAGAILGLVEGVINTAVAVASAVAQSLQTFWGLLPTPLKTVFGMVLIFSGAAILDEIVSITFGIFDFILHFFGFPPVSFSFVIFGLDLTFPYSCGINAVCHLGFFKGIGLILVFLMLIKLGIDVKNAVS